MDKVLICGDGEDRAGLRVQRLFYRNIGFVVILRDKLRRWLGHLLALDPLAEFNEF